MNSYLLLTLCLAIYANDVLGNACKKYECPAYSVVKKFADFEIRLYKPYKFASTVTKGGDYYMVMYKMCDKLHNYFEGANAENQKMPQTFPFMKSFSADGTRGFHYYIPSKFHDDTPTPTNKEISIFTGTGETLAARTFSGFSTEENIKKEMAILAKGLDNEEIAYFGNRYYAGSYNEPGRLSDRVNEVLFTIHTL